MKRDYPIDDLDLPILGDSVTDHNQAAAYADQGCRVYWGSHGCHRERWHKSAHWCDCCTCKRHPDPDSECVAGPPHYGSGTKFYGEDVLITTEMAAAWHRLLTDVGRSLRLDRLLSWLGHRLERGSHG